MPNLAIDSSQLKNADNMNNGCDSEVPLTIIDEIAPISRPSAARGSLSRLVTAQKLGTYSKKKKKKKIMRVIYKKGAWVKMKRHNLFHTLRSDEQKEDTTNCGNIMNSYGKMKQRNGNQGFNENFETLLSENKVLCDLHRHIINEVEER